MLFNVLISGPFFSSLFLVGNVEQEFNYEIECSPEPVWPVNKVQQTECIAPHNLCMPVHASIFMGSDITCIKMLRMPVDGALTRNVLYPLKTFRYSLEFV